MLEDVDAVAMEVAGLSDPVVRLLAYAIDGAR